MNLEEFRAHIRTVDHATLDAYHDELSGKKRRARDPQRRLGYALALDMLCEESELRRPIPPEIAALSDDELAAALES